MHGRVNQTPPAFGLSFREFVAIVAGLMAMTALSIDSMLPALPAIGASLHVANPNSRQWVISAFVLGFGAAQIVHGPLSDRFGRRPVLLIGLLLVVACNLIAAVSATFPLLLAARVASGVAVASCRVLAVSIVRDRFVGDQMARVMSLVTIVFMIVPILAPNVGQAILLVAPWRWIFGVLASAALLLFAWTGLRLQETLDPAHRLPLSFARIGAAFRFVMTDRLALAYTAASMLIQGALYGFIVSVEQIFETTFHAPRLFAPVFSLMAGTMAVAAFANSRIVLLYGTRHVSHRALAGYILFALLHLGVALMGLETVVTFALLQSLMMGCFGLAGANFGALAMENMGRLAGTASSAQGFIQTVGGALIGVVIGQAYNGTTVPLYTGFSLCGLAAFAVVAVAERDRMFGRA